MCADEAGPQQGAVGRLVGVYPLGAHARSRRGHITTAVALELWDTAIRLTYVSNFRLLPDRHDDQLRAWEVRDDAATHYLFFSAGSHGLGIEDHVYGHIAWAPQPPRTATTLTITNHLLGLDVSLSLLDPPGPLVGG